jgi:LPPG:FO 2-phospho-L-lactate transferase
MKTIVLAGGVGGAKLVDGLASLLSPGDLTIIVNTGDDFYHYGLLICPDLDTVCYTLAGIANPDTGWGRKNETWQVLKGLETLGGPIWFQMGDLDLATHLERTRLVKQGISLTQVTQQFCKRWGILHQVLPMSDDPISTMVETVEYGEIHFQEYFVKLKCQPHIKGFRFAGLEKAKPSPEVLEAISRAEMVIFAPSNPWVSIDPIIKIPEVKIALKAKKMIAVSPIIEGHTIKGPAAKMFQDFGIVPSALAVAEHYKDILTAFILDKKDEIFLEKLMQWGIIPFSTDIYMKCFEDRQFLASEIIKLIDTIQTMGSQ